MVAEQKNHSKVSTAALMDPVGDSGQYPGSSHCGGDGRGHKFLNFYIFTL